MWDLIVSVPDHCLSFYFTEHVSHFSSYQTKEALIKAKVKDKAK